MYLSSCKDDFFIFIDGLDDDSVNSVRSKNVHRSCLSFVDVLSQSWQKWEIFELLQTMELNLSDQLFAQTVN